MLGANGINGQDPPIPENSTTAASLWESSQYFYIQTMNKTENDEENDVYVMNIAYTVFGRNGTEPRRGGHGGVGGIGGYPGKVFIVGLQQRPNFTIFNETGNMNETVQLQE